MSDVIVVGDEAWLPEEWERKQAQRRRDRAAERRRRQRPEIKARIQEQQRLYRLAHADELRAYKREWMRRHRADQVTSTRPQKVAALHALGCKGPHRRARKTCTPIWFYDRPVAS